MIEEPYLENINQLLMDIKKSFGIKLDTIKASNIIQVIKISENSNVTVTHSDFNDIGANSVIHGGALQVQNSILRLNNTNFIN